MGSARGSRIKGLFTKTHSTFPWVKRPLLFAAHYTRMPSRIHGQDTGDPIATATVTGRRVKANG